MLVKNISNKPIHVNNTVLLPDDEKHFADSVRNHVIDLFQNMKLLSVSDDAEHEEEIVPATDPEPETENKPKKGGRSKKSE